MNLYLAIILTALILNFLIQTTSRLLNLKHLNTQIPAEFEDVYDGEKYRSSQKYFQAGTKFALISATADLGLLLIFIRYNGFNFLDIWIRSLGFGELATGLLYFAALFIMLDLVSLPFDLYQTFVIEERFGFNKMTWKLYLTDKLKGWLLTLILGGLILGAVLWFFQNSGEFAWLAAWGIVTVFTLISQPLFINVISPLFNKFSPLEDGDLKDAIFQFTRRADFPLKDLFIMDGSKRSSHSNAYFAGLGKSKRIVLYDTLLSQHSNEQIVSVLAHEIGHYKLGHIRKNLTTGIFHSGILFFLLNLFIGNKLLFDAFRMEHMSLYAGFIFFGLLYTPVEMGLAVVLNAVSRRYEYQADAFAVEKTGNAAAVIQALKTLSAENLEYLFPHRLSVILRADHPPTVDRIAAIRKHQPEFSSPGAAGEV